MSDMLQNAVLVVDDEALVRMDLVDQLQARGFRTYEADNAAEAIVVLEGHKDIRVVFTDIQMPGTMDGVALAHYVRERWPPTILIVCSGNKRPEASSLPDACSFISKPFDTGILGGVLDTVSEQLKL
jgi:CheY-like chemotaxis protein